MNSKLRQALAKAINALSAVDALAALNDASFTAEDLPELLGLLERCGRLVFRAANTERENERDDFLTALSDEVGQRFGAECGSLIGSVCDLMHEIEAGYRDIDDGLRSAAVSALPLDRQIAAIVQRAASEADDVRRRGIEAIGRTSERVVGEPVIAHDEWGGAFHPDAVTTGLVENLGSYLKMVGRSQLGATPDGRLLLPLSLGESSEEDRFKAGTSGMSAMAHRRWRIIEERRRFWGGTLQTYLQPDLPDGVSPTVEVVRKHLRSKTDLLDWIANDRLKDVFQHQWDHADRSGPPPGGYKGIDAAAGLPPADIISQKEYVAITALRGLLGAAAFDGGALYRGLSLYEWVRGYAILSALSERAYLDGRTAKDRSLIPFAPGELATCLSRLGLAKDRAAVFVDHATLGTRSDDVFDCPLLATTEGGHVLFGPASIDAVLGMVVLSNLSALGEKFLKKGKWFEQDVLTFLRDRGLPAFGIDAKVNGAQYELDVVAPWGKFLFVFECKNESLSANDPVDAYNFEQSRLEHCAQLERQIAGLNSFPQLSTDRGGPDPNSREIIPVLLYRFPYARPSKKGEILTADWSSLTRFFESGAVNFITRYEEAGEVMHERLPAYRLWSGQGPSADDFLRHLQQPVQLASMLGRLDIRWTHFWLKDHRFGASLEYFRAASDLNRIAAALGADGERIRRSIRKIHNAVSTREKRQNDKLLLRQTRGWRSRRR